MKTFFSELVTDKDLESGAGIVLDYGDLGQITIHRAGGSNKKFANVFAAKLRPYERQMNMGTLSDDLAEQLLAATYAETVIVGWKGVKGEDGKDMPFNKKNCVNLLIKVPELFRDIQEQANKAANFRREQVEEEKGN